jgi:ankyrin repeat protein
VVTLNDGGFTPLLFAARNGDRESAALLIAAGADPNDESAAKVSALIVAAHSGHPDVAKLLIEKGAEVNAAGAGYTALHAAVLMDSLDLVQALLAGNADPNAKITRGTPVRRYSADNAFAAAMVGATPYWLAARYGEIEMMRALAAAGADTRVAMPDGTTALIAAVQAGRGVGSGDRREKYLSPVALAEKVDAEDERLTAAVATLAIELGSDVNASNQAGDTALHMAASQSLDGVVQLLVDKGAVVNVKNKRGDTPLSVTVPRGRGNEGTVISIERRQATGALLRTLGAKQ